MVFWKLTPNLTITNGDFESNFEVLKKKIKKPLKVPSLARSVPKPLKVPSLARSVPKPLKMPSLARSVAKPLKVPSLARSVPKPLLIELREAGGHQPGTYEPLLIFAADLLLSWLWMNDEMMMMMMMMMTFWVFDFYETFICYRNYLKLNCYTGKKCRKNFLWV